MRVFGPGSLGLILSLLPGLARAAEPEAEPPSVPSTPSGEHDTTADPSLATPSEVPNVTPVDQRRPATVLSAPGRGAPSPAPSEHRVSRLDGALLLALEARFGATLRLGSSFAPEAHEEVLDTAWALGGFLAWNPEYALGVELEHSGLGLVRSLSDQNSIDAEYSSTNAYLAARIFPIRSERLDLFVNFRLGLAWQHVDALGTRALTSSITVPASSFSCTEWDGPGVALGGAAGVLLRLTRHVSVLSRVDATGQRLSGDVLGSCAEGMGSVASLTGSVGLSVEFEMMRK